MCVQNRVLRLSMSLAARKSSRKAESKKTKQLPLDTETDTREKVRLSRFGVSQSQTLMHQICSTFLKSYLHSFSKVHVIRCTSTTLQLTEFII